MAEQTISSHAPFDPYRWFGYSPGYSRFIFHDPATNKPPGKNFDTAHKWLAGDSEWKEGISHLRKLGAS